MSLDERKAFAAALWDLPESEAFVLLASTESAHALVREAPPLDELPEVVTPWIRARVWATAHRDAPIAPPLPFEALEREILAANARGLVRANGRWIGERGGTIIDAALAVLGPKPLPFKDVLRRAREAVRASSDDGKRLASALLRAWEDSDVELALRSP